MANSLTVRDYHTEIPGKVVDSEWIFPTIYGVHAGGKQIEWTIKVRAIRLNDVSMPYEKHTEDMFLPLISSNNPIKLSELFDNKPLPANIYGYTRVYSCMTGHEPKRSCPTIVKTGKNLKSKSATNTFCQALRDAYGKYNKQLAHGTLIPIMNEIFNDEQPPTKGKKVISGEVTVSKNRGNEIRKTITAHPLPMLAQSYKDQTVHKFPCIVQPKFNGVRAISTVLLPSNSTTSLGSNIVESTLMGINEVSPYRLEDIFIYSRTGKQYFGFDYIREELVQLFNVFAASQDPGLPKLKLFIDGELYKHGLPLQTISGLVRKQKSHTPDEEKLVYNIYDCFVISADSTKLPDQLVYGERRTILESLFNKCNNSTNTLNTPLKYCALTKDSIANNEDDISRIYKQYLTDGYEGGIVRYNTVYEHKRSKNLLKLKETHDAEYRIVKWDVGEFGKADGAFMIVCETADHKEFTVTPMGAIDDRIVLAKNMNTVMSNGKTVFENEYQGKLVTIIYDELSTDGVPVRARTELVIRDYE